MGCSAGEGWATGVGCSAGAGWATGVGLACDTRGCEAWARLDNALGSRWAWSNMAWALALDGTARAMVMAQWTSPWVATVVTTSVVPVVVTRGGGAAPLRITFNLVDRRGPNS